MVIYNLYQITEDGKEFSENDFFTHAKCRADAIADYEEFLGLSGENVKIRVPELHTRVDGRYFKVKPKVKQRLVRYWDIVFKNYFGMEMTYCCVAPNYGLALKSFYRYMDGAKFTLLSVTTDGQEFTLN